MTIIYITECNTKCYGEAFENKGWIKVRKFEDISDDKKYYILCKTFGSIFG